MKNLLTIVLILLCFVSKAQEQPVTPFGAKQFGLNIEMYDLQRILTMNDKLVDDLLTSRNWVYSTHYIFDSVSKGQRTEYLYNTDKFGGAEYRLAISADSNNVKCGVNLFYVDNAALNNYMVKEAEKSGFRYVDAYKGSSNFIKFYENSRHEGFITTSDSNGAGVDDAGKNFPTQEYVNALTTAKRFKTFREGFGMK